MRILILALLSFPLYAVQDMSHELLIQRIRPLGSVHVDEKEKMPQSSEQRVSTELSGEGVYNQHCAVCHESGVAGAPKFRNQTDWAPRIAKEGGIAGLIIIANQGLNAMPPKGTCQNCTDEELKRAIEFMLPK